MPVELARERDQLKDPLGLIQHVGRIDHLRVLDRGRLIERASLVQHVGLIDDAAAGEPDGVVERARAIEAASLVQHVGGGLDGREDAVRLAAPDPSPRPQPAGTKGRRARFAGLALAFAMPATVAALLVSSLLPDSAPAPPERSALELAKLAELPALRPIVLRDGKAQLGTRPQNTVEAPGPRPAVPVSISIPAADVEAPVEPVRPVRNGVGVPKPGRAGWFEAGARPGEPGRAVVVGHLDTRTGPGLFARLPRLPAGSAIGIRDARGDVHRYQVVGRTRVEKSRFPAHAVYGRARSPVLVLVTCGGPWSPRSGYRDNVIVYARAA